MPPLPGATFTSVPASTNAQVLIGTVEPDGTSKFQGQGTTADFLIKNRYERDGHRYMLGITSPGNSPSNGSVAFVQLAYDTVLWISDWTACQWSTQPQIPNYTSYNPNWILLDTHFEPAQIALAADGLTPIYRITGTYIYGKTNPSNIIVNDITFARPPYIANNIPLNMPASKLTSNLISQGGRG